MTNKEAIEYGKSCITAWKSWLADDCCIVQFYNLAIEALEKQIAKKPIFTEHILIKGCKPSEMRSCPNCKRFFDVTMIGDDFCKRCGQAIDWSDT